MANRVTLSPEYFPNPTIGRPVSNGYVYVGEIDLDPKIVGNQKQVSLLQEDGSEVEVSQPVSLSAGGTPTYNGSPVTILVGGSYSLRVDDKHSEQVYYVPKNAEATGDKTVETIADLRLISGDYASQGVTVQGYYAVGDGGGGPRRYWDVDTYAPSDDNGGSIIVATGVTTGAWLYPIENEVRLEDFGAIGDGVVDDTAVFTTVQGVVSVGQRVVGDSTYLIDTDFILDLPQYASTDINEIVIGATKTLEIRSVYNTIKIGRVRGDGDANSNLKISNPSYSLVHIDRIGGPVGANLGNAVVICGDASYGAIGGLYSTIKCANIQNPAGTAMTLITYPDGATPGYFNECVFDIGSITADTGLGIVKGSLQSDPYNGNTFILGFESIDTLGVSIEYGRFNKIAYPRLETTPSSGYFTETDCIANEYNLNYVKVSDLANLNISSLVRGSILESGGSLVGNKAVRTSLSDKIIYEATESRAQSEVRTHAWLDRSDDGSWDQYAGIVVGADGVARRYGILSPYNVVTVENETVVLTERASYIYMDSTSVAADVTVSPKAEFEGYTFLVEIEDVTNGCTLRQGTLTTRLYVFPSTGLYSLTWRNFKWRIGYISTTIAVTA